MKKGITAACAAINPEMIRRVYMPQEKLKYL